MKKVLIISTDFDEQNMIEGVADLHRPTDPWSIETTASFAKEPTWWVTNAPDLLIVRLPADEFLQDFFLIKIRRDLPKNLAILCLCPSISNGLIQLSQTMQKLRVVKTPVPPQSLYRSVMDLTTEFGPGKKQTHPRYLTDHPIRFQGDLLTEPVEAQMKNLSLGGAYLEVRDPQIDVQSGELLKLQIELGSEKKEYVFDAKVMWVKSQTAPIVLGIGVMFVDQENVYNNLLQTIGE